MPLMGDRFDLYLFSKFRNICESLPFTQSYVYVGVAGMKEPGIRMTTEQNEALGSGSPTVPTKICDCCGGSGRVFVE